MTDQSKTTARLLELGREWAPSPGQPVDFEVGDEANALLNDLEHHPHAFVMGCIADFMIKAERAWLVPFEMRHRLGGDLSIAVLAGLSEQALEDALTTPSALSPYPTKLAHRNRLAIERIKSAYGGDVSRIWSDRPSSDEVVYRFLGFEGVGPKIATMAANILARDFHIPFSDRWAIDVSVDTHVRRVFKRLGLVDTDASDEQVLLRARALNPRYPGELDLPCWEIGRKWCHAKKPECTTCPMDALCPKVRGTK